MSLDLSGSASGFGTAAGTCESIDLEKKELLVRPYPPGLEKDFTVPYDVARPFEVN